MAHIEISRVRSYQKHGPCYMLSVYGPHEVVKVKLTENQLLELADDIGRVFNEDDTRATIDNVEILKD